MSDKLQVLLDSTEAVEAFKAHCRLDLSIESCGLFVLRNGEIVFVPCENEAWDKKNSFLIGVVSYVREADQGDVIGVGHSHVVAPADPSPEDRLQSENCMLPFLIYQPDADVLAHYDPTGIPTPLLGRKWVLGVSDCYTLARDYYKEQGLELKDYMRNTPDVLHDRSMFLEHLSESGFRKIDTPPEKHDAILMQVLADVPNHCAVMCDDNLILHHLQNRLSCRDPYSGYWRRHTYMVLRHEKWL